MKSKKIWVLVCFVVLFSLMLFFLKEQIITTSAYAEQKWWNKFGEPKYGGTINIRLDGDMLQMMLDPYSSWGGPPYFEGLWVPDWTLDRDIYPFKQSFTPDKY